MKFLKPLVVLFLAFGLGASAASSIKSVQENKEYQDVYRATFALYASSEQADVKDKFLCTAEAIQKVQGGYELLSAGHCTPENPELPSDMTFSVAEQLGGPLMEVKLIKAEMDWPLDYSIFYFPTNKKYSVDKLGNEGDARVGDATVDVNFSEAITKELSTGMIASQIIGRGCDDEACMLAEGMFEVQMFGSHGASGSAVLDNGKVIGTLIGGMDGETMPVFVEPISLIKKAIQGVDVSSAPAKTYAPREVQGPEGDAINPW